MLTAICPGSFDPVTLGHVDIIRRAARLFDRVIVLVMSNGEKDKGMFRPEERLHLMELATREIPNVSVALHMGLLADYAREAGAAVLVKGVRSGTDFDWESQMVWINDSLCPGLETVLLPASPQYSWFSSTMAREMIRYDQELERYLPKAVAEEIRKGKVRVCATSR